jgi:hypothetical protein
MLAQIGKRSKETLESSEKFAKRGLTEKSDTGTVETSGDPERLLKQAAFFRGFGTSN